MEEYVRQRTEGDRAGESGDPGIESPKDQEARRYPRGAQKRIDVLTARLRAAEEILQNHDRARANSQQPGEAPKPEATPSAHETEIARDTERIVQRGRQRYGDWDQVFENARINNIQIPEVATEAVRAMGNSADVAYYLAKNPSVAAELLKAGGERSIGMVQDLAEHLERAHDPRHAGWERRVRETLKSQTDSAELAQRMKTTSIPRGLAPAVHRAMVAQENGHDVFMHLLRNPAELQKFSSMTPDQAYAQIVRLAVGLENTRTRPVSKAPDPVEPVSRSTHAGRALSDPDISMEEYARRRQKQISDRRGGGR
jgi:hypothetical protein